MAVDKDKIAQAVYKIMEATGQDVYREGLRDTPERVARFYEEFFDYDPGAVDVAFESISTDQMVAVTGIRVWSLCEHHMLPFVCDISIGYIADSHVLGLSKLARIAHMYAHTLQIQERLVHQIAERVQQEAQTEDVAVVAKGLHLCMAMRGIKTPASMITSALRGRFLDTTRPEVRAEFFTLIQLKGGEL